MNQPLRHARRATTGEGGCEDAGNGAACKVLFKRVDILEPPMRFQSSTGVGCLNKFRTMRTRAHLGFSAQGAWSPAWYGNEDVEDEGACGMTQRRSCGAVAPSRPESLRRNSCNRARRQQRAQQNALSDPLPRREVRKVVCGGWWVVCGGWCVVCGVW